jgi:hypothetical protein
VSGFLEGLEPHPEPAVEQGPCSHMDRVGTFGHM